MRLAPLALLAALGLARPASADEDPGRPSPSARLVYTRLPGAERCPAQQAIEDAVATRLGYTPFREDAPIVVTAVIERRASSVRARVELRDATGKLTGARELTASDEDCTGLVEALAIAVSLGIDPLSLTRPPPAPPPPTPPPLKDTPPPAPAPPPQNPSPPQSAPPKALPPPPAPVETTKPEPRVPIRLRLSAGALLAVGTSPAPSLGILAQVGLRRASASLGLEGRADLLSTARSGSVAVTSSLLSVSLVPCAHYKVLMGCALGSLGELRAQGYGLDDARRDRALHGALGLRVGAELPLGEVLFVRVHGDVAAALTRTSFFVSNRAAWTSPPITAGLGLAVGASF